MVGGSASSNVFGASTFVSDPNVTLALQQLNDKIEYTGGVLTAFLVLVLLVVAGGIYFNFRYVKGLEVRMSLVENRVRGGGSNQSGGKKSKESSSDVDISGF